MQTILSHTPTWVFLLFFYLLLSGMRQLRPHAVPLWRAAVLPVVMLVFSASRFFSAPHEFLPAFSWLLGAALGLALCVSLRYPSGLKFDTFTRCVHLPGSVLPLLAMLAIFGVRFAAGVMHAREPALAASVAVVCGFGLVSGLASGIFFARLVAVLHLLRRLVLRRGTTHTASEMG